MAKALVVIGLSNATNVLFEGIEPPATARGGRGAIEPEIKNAVQLPCRSRDRVAHVAARAH